MWYCQYLVFIICLDFLIILKKYSLSYLTLYMYNVFFLLKMGSQNCINLMSHFYLPQPVWIRLCPRSLLQTVQGRVHKRAQPLLHQRLKNKVASLLSFLRLALRLSGKKHPLDAHAAPWIRAGLSFSSVPPPSTSGQESWPRAFLKCPWWEALWALWLRPADYTPRRPTFAPG